MVSPSMLLVLYFTLFVGGFAFSTTSHHAAESRHASTSVPTSGSDLNSSFQVDGDQITTGMSKLEQTSVKRFTTGYDKLCKNCPTRLQPRVDTLTEMIMGLSDIDRGELLDNVARRSKEANPLNQQLLQSPRDVYDFQTAGMQVKPEKRTTKDRITEDRISAPRHIYPSTLDAKAKAEIYANIGVGPQAKLIKKMSKIKIKFDSNKIEATRARRLLAVTNALLARDKLAHEPTIYNVANPIDNGWYHKFDDFKKLSRAELKMERLKLIAQKAKCDQKVAKQRLKLYEASMELADSNKGRFIK